MFLKMKSPFNLKGLLPLIKVWFGKIWETQDGTIFRLKKKLVVKGGYLYAKGPTSVV